MISSCGVGRRAAVTDVVSQLPANNAWPELARARAVLQGTNPTID
jgi:hypothetical protein